MSRNFIIWGKSAVIWHLLDVKQSRKIDLYEAIVVRGLYKYVIIFCGLIDYLLPEKDK